MQGAQHGGMRPQAGQKQPAWRGRRASLVGIRRGAWHDERADSSAATPHGVRALISAAVGLILPSDSRPLRPPRSRLCQAGGSYAFGYRDNARPQDKAALLMFVRIPLAQSDPDVRHRRGSPGRSRPVRRWTPSRRAARPKPFRLPKHTLLRKGYQAQHNSCYHNEL